MNTNLIKQKLIAYYRVSTDKQGKSGLGLEAQQAAIAAYATNMGIIVAQYTEIESGKNNDRPQLAKAISHARRVRGTLVVAKLDRLARNVAFLAKLMESDINFVACDNPEANKLTLHILSAVAENEARAISDRTKAALAAYKARGGVLGGARPDAPKLSKESARKGQCISAIVRRKTGDAVRAEVRPLVEEMRNSGMKLEDIAQELNFAGYSTPRRKPWSKGHISSLLKGMP